MLTIISIWLIACIISLVLLMFRDNIGWYTQLVLNIGSIENGILWFSLFLVVIILLPLSLPFSLIDILWRKK